MSFGAPEVTFGKFRHHFDFWSQLKPGSNLDNLGGYLGNICLEVSMGVWVPSVGSFVGGQLGDGKCILLIYRVNLRAGVWLGGEYKPWWIQGSAEVARIRCGESRNQFGGMRKLRELEQWGWGTGGGQ